MKFWKEVSPFSGQGLEEDAPVNSVAGGGVSMPPDAVHHKKKKKVLQTREGVKIDGRTKSYKEHRKKLKLAREKRRLGKSSRFIETIRKRMSNVKSS